MESQTADIRFLTDSPNRGEVLRVVAEDGPLDRYDIEERVDATRRTVVRNLNELSDRGHVVETETGYRTTPLGAFTAESYARFVSETALADRLTPFLRHAPPSVFDLDPRHLADADIVTASETSPFAVLNRVLELRREASEIREVAPGIERQSIEQLARRVRDGETLEMTTVIPPDAAEEAMTNPDYRDDHVAALRADGIEMFVYPERIPLFVGVLGETVALAAGTDGRPNALVTTTDATVREWAEETIEAFRAESEPHTA